MQDATRKRAFDGLRHRRERRARLEQRRFLRFCFRVVICHLFHVENSCAVAGTKTGTPRGWCHVTALPLQLRREEEEAEAVGEILALQRQPAPFKSGLLGATRYADQRWSKAFGVLQEARFSLEKARPLLGRHAFAGQVVERIVRRIFHERNLFSTASRALMIACPNSS